MDKIVEDVETLSCMFFYVDRVEVYYSRSGIEEKTIEFFLYNTILRITIMFRKIN